MGKFFSISNTSLQNISNDFDDFNSTTNDFNSTNKKFQRYL